MTQTATTEIPKRKKRSKKESPPEKEKPKNGKQKKVEAKAAPSKNGKSKKEALPLPAALLPEEQETKGKSKKLINVDALILESCKAVGISCEYPVQFSSPVNCVHSGSFLFDLVSSGGFRNGRMHTISGPSGGEDVAYSLFLESDGDLVLTGVYTEPDGGSNILVSKFRPDFTHIQTLTFDGSSGGYDSGFGIILTSSNEVFVSGFTTSITSGMDIWLAGFEYPII